MLICPIYWQVNMFDVQNNGFQEECTRTVEVKVH